jgi:hypothetical protein
MPRDTDLLVYPSGSRDSVTTGEDGSTRDTVLRRHRQLWPGLLCCVLYLAFACAAYGFGPIGSSRLPGGKWNDSVEQIWWLAWAAHALPDVHNLFLARGQNYPYGQNFGVNGSMLLLGVLFAPITKLFGPIVTFDVLLRLAVAGSAASMCFVLRRWTSWWPAAFVGGALYGFSPYMRTFGSDLFLVFVPLPPLILLTLHETFVRQKWRAGLTGILLGLLCALQFFVWVEVLAGTIVIGAVGVVAMLVVTRDRLADSWRYAVTAIAYALFVFCLLLVYPLIYTFTGPQSIRGSPQSTSFLGRFNTDVISSVQETAHQWLVLLPASNNNTLYLGLPLVIVLACFALFLRRRREILFAGAMALVAFVLSLGSSLTIDGHRTWVRLPFCLFARLPALSGFEARRFALFTDLFAAAMIAIGMDELRRRLPSLQWWRTHRWNVTLGVAAAGILALAVILSLVPGSIQPSSPTRVPAFFSSGAVDAIPSGGVVLAYPYPDALGNSVWTQYLQPTVDSPMLDQAVSGMRFALIGGFGWFPSPSGNGGTGNPADLQPRSVQALFDSAYFGARSPKGDLTGDLRTFLQRYRVEAVLMMAPDSPLARLRSNPGLVVSALIEVAGPPQDVDGVTAWLNIGRRLSARPREAAGVAPTNARAASDVRR